MKRLAGTVLVIFILAFIGYGVSFAQYDESGSSLDSSASEEGSGEIQQMDSEMDVQPGDTVGLLEEKGMDVQSGDAMDSEGAGAH